MYGLASRLGACRAAASTFATEAGMRDPNTPLLGGFDEERWDPNARMWQEMEACVHSQAGLAGARVDDAWRAPLKS